MAVPVHRLASVRIHDDGVAAASAASLGALAYTIGPHIVLGDSRGTAPSRDALLAHEAAHVVQQGVVDDSGMNEALTSSSPELEAEAHAAASGAGRIRAGAAAGPRLLRWDSPEHVDLGDTATGGPHGDITLNCHDRDFPERANPPAWRSVWRDRLAARTTTADQRRAVTSGLTYGEVVALSGDFYRSFQELTDAPLLEIFDLIPLIHKSAGTAELQSATGGRYLDLASENMSHFSNVPSGGSNIETWHRLHTEAVRVAAGAHSQKQLADTAWAMNAAADHFLTDAFSGGHIRTPRAQLHAQGKLGDVESKIEHDLDNTYGVEVTNARGDQPWIAYGDLLLNADKNRRNRELALEAVALSKRDIETALTSGAAGPLPARFASEDLVPVPVDPTKDRWTGRTPTFAPTPLGPVQQEDDYTAMTRHVIATEAPDVLRGALLTDDDDIRDWVNRQDLEAVSRLSPAEKIRMIDTIIGGFFSWISEDDVRAIERICGSVRTAGEMKILRDRFFAEVGSRMTSFGQRARVRVALTRL